MKKEIKILFLEDSAADAELNMRELTGGGLLVSSKRVETKEEYVRALKDFEPDVILADYSLPSFNGEEALDIALNCKKSAPFIFVTGTMGEELAIETLKRGAADYVLKQNFSRLVPAVRRVLRDEEEKKRRIEAEHALIESERNYRTIFETAPNMIITVSSDRVVTDCNKRIHQYLGYQPFEIIGRSILDLVHPDYRGKAANLMDEIFRIGFSFNNECVMVRKDGSDITVNVNSSVLKSKIKTDSRIVCILDNITERKAADEKLKANAGLLKIAGDKAKLGGWNVDLKNNLCTWSDETAAIHERPAGYAPLVEEGISYYAPEWRGKITQVFTECAQNGIPYDEEMEIISANGRRVWVRTIGEPVKDKAGKIIKVQGAFQDITERKRAEEKIIASLREKEVLLKEIHHRVKNNMQIISSMISLQFNSSKILKSNPEVVAIGVNLQNRIKSMALIHEKLYQSDSLADINLREYVQSLCSNIAWAGCGDAARITVKIDIGDINPGLSVAVPCGLIINELVSNALKHAFPSKRAGEIRVKMYMGDDGYYNLSVSDNGIGLPAGFSPGNIETLGMRLVGILAKQIDGSFKFVNKGGAKFMLKFPGPLKPPISAGLSHAE